MRTLFSTLVLATALTLPGVALAEADLGAAEAALQKGAYGTALNLYRTAADTGDARAQVTLGYMYLYGEAQYGPAVQGDTETALGYFASAAAQGNAVAISMLSLLFRDDIPAMASPALAAVDRTTSSPALAAADAERQIYPPF
jgi:TPR repeat protein